MYDVYICHADLTPRSTTVESSFDFKSRYKCESTPGCKCCHGCSYSRKCESVTLSCALAAGSACAVHLSDRRAVDACGLVPLGLGCDLFLKKWLRLFEVFSKCRAWHLFEVFYLFGENGVSTMLEHHKIYTYIYIYIYVYMSPVFQHIHIIPARP